MHIFAAIRPLYVVSYLQAPLDRTHADHSPIRPLILCIECMLRIPGNNAPAQSITISKSDFESTREVFSVAASLYITLCPSL